MRIVLVIILIYLLMLYQDKRYVQKMKYQFIKIFQVTITAFITILQPIGLAYPLCIIIAILPKKYHWINSFISIIANIICIGEGSFSITLLLCCILLIFLAWWGNTSLNQNTVAINNLVMYLLICLALCSARQNLIFKYLHLAMFYLCLLLAHYTSTKWIKLSCWLIIVFFSIEIILLIISRLFNVVNFIPPQPENWQLICAPITLCIAVFIIKYEQFQIIPQQMIINQGIEMKQYSSNQSKSNNNILQQPLLQNQLDKAIKSQSQFLNILLIIPFCCFNMGILQIIPYLYFIFTQYNITSSVLYFLTLLCLLSITVLQSSSQLYINLLLRFCLVFFVDKNLQIGWQMASLVSSLWLKTSFIFVLIIMFWFSLKTVNIFHLGFICILLLFITKNNQNHQTISFRHKYWIYLLTLFNFFLILRLLYEIIVLHYSIEINPLINAPLALFGFSYVYTSSLNMFNCIPMIISASLGFQYLTYCSRIYQIHSHQPILPAYREILNHLLRITTILYYKLIPWVSYAIVLITLLPLQFSCSSGILLLWILLILTIQILLPNQLNSYCRLYWLWLIYSRINALRIILRYIFEFAKFPAIYHVLHKLPFFQVLIRYEQFLGLMIRQGSYVYFKTISKFQIMISLDLASIFIAFLLIQYYQILITYHTIKIDNQQQGNYAHYNVENQRIIQLYTSYIDFKLTLWFTTLNTLIRKFSKIYITLFYPLICIIICLKEYISMLLLLIIILIHYLGLNTIYYETYIKPLTAQKMLNLLIKWRTTNIKQQAVQLTHNLSLAILHVKQYQLSQHNKLRKYLITIIMMCLLLCYFSRILLTSEIISLISEQNTIISLRWALYLNGTSIECGKIINIYLIILVMLVIDLKCCGFLQKYYLTRSQALQPSQQRKQKSKLEPQVSNISQKSENNGLQLLQNRDVEQNSKVKQHRQQTLKYIEMKIVQRSFVLILILASIIEDHHPFGIIYLLWAVILNFLGPISILSLSRVLIIMLLLEYVMLLMNYWDVSLTSLPNTQMKKYQNRTLWSYLVSPQWQQYIKFGDNIYEIIVLIISITLLISYQVYFIILHHNWLYILKLLNTKLQLTTIQYKIYHYSKQIYQYCLIYSPLCLTTICLAVYFLDFTTTNLFLTIISILFLFKSFLIEDYANSRLFWKFYFMLLQLLIVIFMVLYELLNIPMYHSYCNPILCSSEQFHTKISKAILLFILQIGIDLMKSQQFVTALKQLKSSLSDASKFSRLAIAYKHNDSKIAHKFRRIAKQKQLTVHMKQVQNFLNEHKNNSTLTLNNRKQIIMNSQSWLDTILNIMPTLVDSSMILTFEQAKQLIINENYRWIHNRNILQVELYTINETYMNVFADIDDNNVLITMLQQQIQINNSKILKHSISRKSFIDDLMPFESSQLCLSKIEQQTSKQYQFQQKQQRQIKDTILQQQNSMSEQKIKSKSQKDLIKQQKHQLLYLLILDSVLSNWSYLTYILLILLHIRNLGLLTLPFPIIVFCFGVICSYQPGKLVWRVLFLWTLVPITIKFIIQIGILQLSQKQQYILIGDNISSIMLEYLVLLFILIQCLILKAINLYNEDVVQVECMRIALIRNIINHNSQQEKDMLQLMLKDANYIPEDHKQFIFGNSQCKPGYDYSTLLTSLQLIILVYIFLFYDNMAIRKKVTFYQMIEYNQFKAGMVIMILIQLFFLLASRFLISVNLSEYSQKWNCTLFLKYSLMVLNIIYMQVTVLVFFPFNSNNFTNSTYISLFYILNAFYILLTSLQIKYGIDQESKGFMDRYTWYNGFIYMAFRAIPFLFEFKVFSDWTSTRTSLRLFDWIKLQQIFGRIYIAKCNSLFLQGKQIGSKIQWWKKLLMGYPLLLAIILLLFGPLVLFSSLNPLASTNEVTAGYLQLSLKINHTNQYPLYTNSHITDIDALVPTNAEIQMLKAHDLDPQAAQLLQLEEYSDQYWQISEGSYYKLLEQPLNSHYQLLIRIKFERNLTGSTPLYTLNSYTIPSSDISHFKEVLKGHQSMKIANFMDQFLRLDNNNGLHILGTNKHSIIFFAKESQRANKKYWMIESGLDIRMLSDRYTRAIFGYSVMSFYISIILVIANYFRFLFQGSAHTIILSDIPMADSLLTIYNAIYQARRNFNIQQQEILFWTLIDILRSPDTIKAMTGNYLQARMETKKNN